MVITGAYFMHVALVILGSITLFLFLMKLTDFLNYREIPQRIKSHILKILSKDNYNFDFSSKRYKYFRFFRTTIVIINNNQKHKGD